MRVKAKWHKNEQQRSWDEIAGALAFTTWKACMQGVLNLENEDFQTDTLSQRMDIIAEFSAFLIHVVDRISYDRLNNEERGQFINAFGNKMVDFMDENRTDVEGPGNHRADFIALLNQRMEDYAACSFDDGGPGFSMRRTFGDHVTQVMGEKNRKWVTDQVMDIEVPEALQPIKKALKSLLGWDI